MDRLIGLDQQLFLLLNGSESSWLDVVMLTVTSVWTWTLLLLALVTKVSITYDLRRFLLFFVVFGLVILCADQLSSSLMKPLFHRLRPSHEPSLSSVIDIVGNYRGGMYGFVSSHAANMFGVATYISLVLRGRMRTLTVFLWALIGSYSRIYLGVHYPGDVLCGALLGVVVGWLCAQLFLYLFPMSFHRPSFRFIPRCPQAEAPGGALLASALALTLAVVCVGALVIVSCS